MKPASVAIQEKDRHLGAPHEPTGWKGAHQFCSVCGRDLCDEPGLQDRGEPYESDMNMYCVECAADEAGVSVLDVVKHLAAEGSR